MAPLTGAYIPPNGGKPLKKLHYARDEAECSLLAVFEPSVLSFLTHLSVEFLPFMRGKMEKNIERG